MYLKFKKSEGFFVFLKQNYFEVNVIVVKV